MEYGPATTFPTAESIARSQELAAQLPLCLIFEGSIVLNSLETTGGEN